MNQTPLFQAGYEFLNIDDCWMLMDRDNVTGDFIEDPEKFPKGVGGFQQDLSAKYGMKLGSVHSKLPFFNNVFKHPIIMF